ncbi:MAG: MotE family protein [Syntrophomonadaceae bacterium]
MQTKITYFVIFLTVFILTTGGIVFLNQKYENIFKLDFSPRKVTAAVSSPDSLKADIDTTKLQKQWVNKVNQQAGDSLSAVKGSGDTQAIIAERNRQLDSLNKIKNAIAQYDVKLKSKETELQSTSAILKVNQDSAYVKWKKEMVKTYELMDSKMVAKIIQKLNDNLAKDILFSIKKKKRAQIIAEFSPETAVRLTRMQ